jgi:hypothetical protein
MSKEIKNVEVGPLGAGMIILCAYAVFDKPGSTSASISRQVPFSPHPFLEDSGGGL